MGNYDDIINLPHHTSPTRPRMSMSDRAAQFSPFAALTGYDAAVKETARLTDRRIELDEYEKAELNRKLCILAEHQKEALLVELTFFQPDMRKEGGAYIHRTGVFWKLDLEKGRLLLEDRTAIPIEELRTLEIRSPK